MYTSIIVVFLKTRLLRLILISREARIVQIITRLLHLLLLLRNTRLIPGSCSITILFVVVLIRISPDTVENLDELSGERIVTVLDRELVLFDANARHTAIDGPFRVHDRDLPVLGRLVLRSERLSTYQMCIWEELSGGF